MYIGRDTHKKTHTLVGLDEQGRPCGTGNIPNTPEGWATGWRWAQRVAGTHIWGIEHSGSLGKGLAQFLLSQGESRVVEVSPQRTAHYRRRGRTQDKTDPADALAIARLLVAEAAHLPAVQRDDLSTELRVLSDHRDNLVVERTRLINQLHAQMLQVDPQYQERSGPLTTTAGRVYCRTYSAPPADRLTQTRMLIVQQLVDQLAQLETAIAGMAKEIAQRVAASRTPVQRLCGVGVLVAARLLGELGSTPRVRSAAALAALAGIAPLAVSSGGRHSYRVNPGGNRQLNRAIHLIALVQRRCEPRARAYYEKKRAEGKTKRAAMRCLKRRLVDVLFRLLHQPAPGQVAAARVVPE